MTDLERLYAVGKMRCSTCKTVKNIGEFHKNKGSRYGVANECATCCVIRKARLRQSVQL